MPDLMKNDADLTPQQAHLFTLRVWMVEKEQDAPTWRVRLQDIHSGEVNYCRDWDSLISCIEKAVFEHKHKSIVHISKARNKK